MAKQFWVKHEGKTTGPFSGSQLKQMAKAGIVGETDTISPDQETWYPAPDVRGLFPAEQTAGQHGGDVASTRPADLTAYAVESGPDSGRHIAHEPTVHEVLPVRSQGRGKRWLLLALALLVATGIGWGLSIVLRHPADMPTGVPDGDGELTLDLGKGVTMKLVWIPAGKFLMGSSATEIGCAGARPHHLAITFLMDRSRTLRTAVLPMPVSAKPTNQNAG